MRRGERASRETFCELGTAQAANICEGWEWPAKVIATPACCLPSRLRVRTIRSARFLTAACGALTQAMEIHSRASRGALPEARGCHTFDLKGAEIPHLVGQLQIREMGDRAGANP
jgi:hypothetical protein